MSTFVESAIDEEVATITIDRPERHNSLVPPLLDELRESLAAADGDEAVKAIMLETAGPSFSTGGDVAAFYEHREDIVEYAERTVGGLQAVMLTMLRSQTPIVVAVDGVVTGGSLGLLLGGDVVLMGEDATITPYYTVVGFSPDGGWTAILPEIIGRQRTARILLANETIYAAEAVEWGIASEVVPEGSVSATAHDFATDIAGKKQGSIKRCLPLLAADIETIENRLRAETTSFIEQVQTAEARKGMEDFLESV